MINTTEESQKYFGRFSAATKMYFLKFKIKTNWRTVNFPVKAIRYIDSESKNWDLDSQCIVGFSAKTDYSLRITFLLGIES